MIQLEAMPAVPEWSQSSFKELARWVNAHGDFDLLAFKPRLLKRRLVVRLRARQCQDLESYMKVLATDPIELIELKKVLAIHVSRFFRNRELFWALRDRVLPEIFRMKARHAAPLTIVSAGCAEGEEPYGLAMLLERCFASEIEESRPWIVGLDMDKGILARAHAASYEAERLKDLPRGWKPHFFQKRGKVYELRPEIRGMVEFMVHDLRRGLPFKGVDLLLCRNVLIYYDREAKKKILHGFHGSLAPGGFLALGKTEVLLGLLRGRFNAVDYREHIYQKAGE